MAPLNDLFDKGGVWYVQKYEVDGSDSTEQAFQGFQNNREVCKLTFYTKKAKNNPSPIVIARDFKSLFEFLSGPSNNRLKFKNSVTHCDQAKDQPCARNVLFMNGCRCCSPTWKINSLSKDNLVMTYDKESSSNSQVKKLYTLTLARE